VLFCARLCWLHACILVPLSSALERPNVKRVPCTTQRRTCGASGCLGERGRLPGRAGCTREYTCDHLSVPGKSTCPPGTKRAPRSLHVGTIGTRTLKARKHPGLAKRQNQFHTTKDRSERHEHLSRVCSDKWATPLRHKATYTSPLSRYTNRVSTYFSQPMLTHTTGRPPWEPRTITLTPFSPR